MSDLGSKKTRSVWDTVHTVGAVLVKIGVKFALIVGVGIVAIVLLCLILFIGSGPRVPSDKQMLNHYAEHKSEFDRLAEMFAVEDELSLVYSGSGRCETNERQPIEPGENDKCDEYVRLFRSLEIGWAYVDGAPVRLSFYTWGLTGHGLTKGFLYATDLSGLGGIVVKNTATRGNPTPRYREIDENWYIFFE